MSQSTSHENNFAILHVLGACLVMYGHQIVLLGNVPLPIFTDSAQELGVELIFTITGYLVTLSFLKEQKFGRFIAKRLIRIYPAYIFCILVSALVIGPIVTQCSLGEYFRYCWTYIANNLVFKPTYELPGVFANNIYPGAVNGSVWTLPLEIFMYFVISILLMICLRSKKYGRQIYGGILIALMAACMIKYYCFPEASLIFWNTDWLSLSTVDDLCFIMMGSLYAALELKKFCNIQIASIVMLAGACLDFSKMDLVLVIILPYFIISFAYCEKPFFSKWFSKNNIAYAMFLWGFPIQQTVLWIIREKLGMEISINKAFLISVVITAGVACFSHRFIETPVEGFLKRVILGIGKKPKTAEIQ